jgi:Putative binding domain, N-terminal
MEQCPSAHLSRPTRVAVSVGLLLFAVACGNSGSTTSPSPGGCQFITGTTTTTFPAAGGSASISVSPRGTNCAWTAVSSAPFLTITQGASGTGEGTVQFAVAANTGPERTATLTITGTAIVITQRAP